MAVRFVDGDDPEYEFLDVVGRGSTCIVTKERRIRDGKIMICKSIDCSSNPAVMTCIVRKLSLVSTPALTDDDMDEYEDEDTDDEEYGGPEQDYIARFSEDFSICERTSKLRLYMDFYAGGDLQSMIDSLGERYETICPITAVTLAMQIASAVNTYHGQGITYKDLKPSKVLLGAEFPWNTLFWDVSSRDSLTDMQKQILVRDSEEIKSRYLSDNTCFVQDCCLGGFTDTLKLSRSGSKSTSLADSHCLAPENISNPNAASFKSDIFNLGCLLYMMCTGRHPFPNNDFTSTCPPISTAYPEKFAQAIYECLSLDPANRPTGAALAANLALIYCKEAEQFMEMTNEIRNPSATEEAEIMYTPYAQTEDEDEEDEGTPLFISHKRKRTVDMVENVLLKRWLMYDYN